MVLSNSRELVLLAEGVTLSVCTSLRSPLGALHLVHTLIVTFKARETPRVFPGSQAVFYFHSKRLEAENVINRWEDPGRFLRTGRTEVEL